MCIGICDDTWRDCLQMKEVLTRVRSVDEICTYENATAFLKDVERGRSFLCLFLDILMPGVSGIALHSRLKEIGKEIPIIYVTESPDYAVEAFSLHAVHYLLKPLREEDVVEALSRLEAFAPRKGITFQIRGASHFVYMDEIVLCESSRHTVCITLKTGEQLRCYMTMESFRQLVGPEFILISRGLLVHAEYINIMEGKACVLRDGRRILLSRGHLQEIQEAYQQFLFSRLLSK